MRGVEDSGRWTMARALDGSLGDCDVWGVGVGGLCFEMMAAVALSWFCSKAFRERESLSFGIPSSGFVRV